MPNVTTAGVSFSNRGHDREKTSGATLGQGRIRVGGEEKSEDELGINRDVASRQVVTKDETLGGLDVDVSVDAAMITDTGQWVKDSVSAVSGLVYTKEAGIGGNTKRASQRVGDAVSDVKDAAVSGLSLIHI